jgi:hypothetical protein
VELTRDEITRAADNALERCSREGSKWTQALLVANMGRELPRQARGSGHVAQSRPVVATRTIVSSGE